MNFIFISVIGFGIGLLLSWINARRIDMGQAVKSVAINPATMLSAKRSCHFCKNEIRIGARFCQTCGRIVYPEKKSTEGGKAPASKPEIENSLLRDLVATTKQFSSNSASWSNAPMFDPSWNFAKIAVTIPQKHTCGKDGDPGAVTPLSGECLACKYAEQNAH